MATTTALKAPIGKPFRVVRRGRPEYFIKLTRGGPRGVKVTQCYTFEETTLPAGTRVAVVRGLMKARPSGLRADRQRGA